MAEATIDSLKLEISSSSDGASNGLDALTTSLKKLQRATSKGLGLTSVVNELRTADTSIKSSSLDGLTKAVETLSKLGEVKISSSIGNQITAISTSLQGANFDGGAEKMQSLVTALEPLGELGKSNLSSYATALKKLPETFAELNKIDMDAVTAKVQELATALKPLGDEMQKVANGFSAFPAKIQKLITSTDKLSTSNKNASDSYVNLYAKLKMAKSSVMTIGRTIASFISKSNDYIEDVNLFTAAMGEYADAAKEYAEQVGEVMGIDPGEWMRNQGIFMTLATGFGVASDKAYTMSKNLTQLGYDMSSFFNISYEDAMQKLQSALAGELEPVRRVGYDLSKAALQQIAMDSDNYTGSLENLSDAMSDTAIAAYAQANGITKSFNEMTQAEKSQLRYIALMEQVTVVQGDMSRTLDSPSNQLRVFKAQVTQAARAIGNIFIPALNAILPYGIAILKVIRNIAEGLATLVGFEMPEVDYSSINSVTGSAEDGSDALNDMTKSAKKLKSYMMGFDELNVIDPDSGVDTDADDILAQLNLKLPDYKFFDETIISRADALLEDAKEILATVGAIGTGFAAWAISTKFLKALKEIKKLTGKKINWGNLMSGAALFLQDLTTMKEYLEDFAENGATLGSVAGILSTFAGMVGDAMIILGKVEIGGALKVVEGIGQLVSEVAKMSKEGVNADGILEICNGLSNIVIGIGALTKNWKAMGVGMTLQGFTTIIDEIAENWDAIKEGDWSGVDVAAMAIGAIEMIAGIVTVLGVFNKTKSSVDTAKAAKDIGKVGDTVADVSTTTSTLTSKLKSLATNLALGIVILAEVAVAAGIIVGAIWGLGVLLDETGKAWQPVIDNAATVAIAVGVGTGLLVGIGAATAGLGSIGTALIVNLALGTAMLALVGANAILFLAEILIVGKMLDEIGKAWQPVLDNGDTIATAIGLGTAILLAVGIVCAALGALTMASGGTVAAALALGTAMLALLGVAAILFLAEIKLVGESLVEIGEKWQPVLDNGDTIAKGIGAGTTLLIGIGVVAAALGAAAVASVGALPVAIALGTAMLVQLADAFVKFCDSLSRVSASIVNTLAPALSKMNVVLPGVQLHMSNFTSFMGEFAQETVSFTKSSAIAGIAATVDKIIDFFTTDPIKRMSDNVTKQYNQSCKLYDDLVKAIPKIKATTDKMKEYNDAMDRFETTTGLGSNKNGIIGYVLDFAVNVMNTSELWSNLKNGAINAWSGVQAVFSKVGTFFEDTFEGAWTKVKNVFSTGGKIFDGIKDGIVSGFKTIVNGLIKGINTVIATPFNAINGVIKTIKDVNIAGLKPFKNLPTISVPQIPLLATGGFPEQGQMFIAREAGAELVGNIGGRTAVVNNDQIVESVSAGVYQAVLAAFGSNGDESGETNIVINLDGEKIYENQQKIARGRGYNLGMGAFSFG